MDWRMKLALVVLGIPILSFAIGGVAAIIFGC